jgi:hypothetical protein
MWRRLCATPAVLFLGLLLGLMLCGRSRLFRDPGTFWHTAFGEQILSTRTLVRADECSFTVPGRPWTDTYWLAECGMAALHRIGGWDALLLATAALLAAVYTHVAVRLLRAGLHLLPTLLVLAAVLAASSHQFHARPVIVTIALLAWTFALLVDVEAGRRRLGALGWLVAALVVWTNLHGGVLGGVGTVGLVGAGWLLAWCLGKKETPVSSPSGPCEALMGQVRVGRENWDSPRERLRPPLSPVRSRSDALLLGALLAASAAALLVNPAGADFPWAWLETLRLPLPDLIEEHAPLDLRQPYAWLIVLLGAGYLASVASILPRRPRVTWLLPLVWFVLACLRIRHAPLFAVTAATAWAEMLPHTRWAGWLSRRKWLRAPGAAVGRDAHKAATLLLPLAVLVVAMGLEAAAVPVPVVGHGWAQFDAVRWPTDLVPELQEIETHSASRARIFNDMLFGGFLIYHTPRLAIFIDDRCDLYGGDFLRRYDHARQHAPAQIDAWAAEYGFRHALVEAGSAWDRYLAASPGWRLVRRVPAAALYVRRLGP